MARSKAAEYRVQVQAGQDPSQDIDTPAQKAKAATVALRRKAQSFIPFSSATD